MYDPFKISILLISLSLLFTVTISQQCQPYDKNVLSEIKKQLGNPPSWSSTDSYQCCWQYGGPTIYCDNGGHVAYLRWGPREWDLPEDWNLSGPIPPAVGDLIYLEYLYVSDSKLSGPFPEAICNLTNLKFLSITSTNITGPIPDCLGRLKSLTSLEIVGNHGITGPIPNTMAQLTNLVILQLQSNNLLGPIPEFLGGLPSLGWIDLGNNSLSGSIPASIGFLPQLASIRLSGNRLTGSIPASFGSLKGHMNMELSGNQLSGPIPRTMSRVSVRKLDLSNNSLTGDASFLFGRNKTLARSINLSNNGFEFDFSKVDFPLSLVELNITHNKIYGSLPKQSGELWWHSIDVSYNQLCGPIPNTRQLTRLSPVYFSNNKCLCGDPLHACN